MFYAAGVCPVPGIRRRSGPFLMQKRLESRFFPWYRHVQKMRQGSFAMVAGQKSTLFAGEKAVFRYYGNLSI